MENTFKPMPYDWVAAYFDGEQGKYVKSVAQAGIGYYMLEDSKGNACKVAFRRPKDSRVPEHLQVITEPRLVGKLERWKASEV